MKRHQAAKLALIGCSITTAFLYSNCKKQPEDKVFGGNGRIRGVVLFRNVMTNKLDTAEACVISFTKDGKAVTTFTQTLTAGKFDFTLLQSGSYSFDIKYSHSIAGSANSISYQLPSPVIINLSGGQFIDQYEFSLVPNITVTPTLQISVRNKGVAVANAQVFLYADTVTLRKNRRTGAGSIKSGSTNSNGLVVFDNLQALNYYAAVYAVQGSDTLSNMGIGEQISLTTAVLNPAKLNIASVDLTKEVAADSYVLTITTTDQNRAFVPGASISIYSDKSLFDKNRLTGAGSIASAVSGQNGRVKFTGLQALPYFISAYKIVGKDTLSNRLTDQNPISPLLKNTDNVSTVVIK